MGAAKSKRGSLLVVGLDGAGKTTINFTRTHGYTKPKYETSLGHKLNMNAYLCKEFIFSTYDFKGQKEFRHLWRAPNVDGSPLGIIFVVDSSELPERIAETREFLSKILRVFHGSSIPVFVTANKQDLAGALSPQELAEKLNLGDLEVKRNGDLAIVYSQTFRRPLYIHRACALTGEGLLKAVKKMYKLIRESEKLNKKLT